MIKFRQLFLAWTRKSSKRRRKTNAKPKHNGKTWTRKSPTRSRNRDKRCKTIRTSPMISKWVKISRTIPRVSGTKSSLINLWSTRLTRTTSTSGRQRYIRSTPSSSREPASASWKTTLKLNTNRSTTKRGPRTGATSVQSSWFLSSRSLFSKHCPGFLKRLTFPPPKINTSCSMISSTYCTRTTTRRISLSWAARTTRASLRYATRASNQASGLKMYSSETPCSLFSSSSLASSSTASALPSNTWPWRRSTQRKIRAASSSESPVFPKKPWSDWMKIRASNWARARNFSTIIFFSS